MCSGGISSWRSGTAFHACTHVPSKEDLIVAKDASDSWGCGAVWSQNWFHCPWNEA